MTECRVIEFVRQVHHRAGDAAAGLEGPAEASHTGDLVQLDATAGVVQTDRDAQLTALKRVERNIILGHAGAVGEGYIGILYDRCRFWRRRHRILKIRCAPFIHGLGLSRESETGCEEHQ